MLPGILAEIAKTGSLTFIVMVFIHEDYHMMNGSASSFGKPGLQWEAAVRENCHGPKLVDTRRYPSGALSLRYGANAT